MKTFRQYLGEMALKSYRTDFHHEPKDDEGFYRKTDGAMDLGNQVYRPHNHDNSQPQVFGYFSGKDRAVITHPRTFRALEGRLARSGYDFNILLIEDAGADYDEQVEQFMRENGIEQRGHITFVKNGTSGHVMTPWMILHTLGHAVAEHAGGERSGRAVGAKSRIQDGATDIMSLVSGKDCRTAGRGSPGCKEALGKVLAFKSAARQDSYSTALNQTELVHELVAEFLWNGDRIRVKPPHDADADITRLVGEIEGEVRILLDNCVGKVVYDWFDG